LVHARLEADLNAAARPISLDSAKVLEEAEQGISAWETSLADHVRFGEESTTLHLAMFETSSNAGAWCYFMMHALHAWCLLILSEVYPCTFSFNCTSP